MKTPPPPLPPKADRFSAPTKTDSPFGVMIGAVGLAAILLILLLLLFLILAPRGGGSPPHRGRNAAASSGESENSSARKRRTTTDGSDVEVESTDIIQPAPSQPSRAPVTDAVDPTLVASKEATDVAGGKPEDGNRVAMPNYTGIDSKSSATSIVLDNGANPFDLSGQGARSIVFIVDKSSSVSGHNFQRIIIALSEAIDHLKEEQEFLVLFFDSALVVDPQFDRLRPASSSNKVKAQGWMRSIRSDGGTEPLAAMHYGLKQGPERMVVLSDGEFNPIYVDEITVVNRDKARPARIDAIGLAEVVATLQDLSRRNDGIYYQAR